MIRASRCIAALGLAALLAAGGCSSVDHKREAERFVNGYYEALQAGRVEDAMAMCAPEFFDATPREDWLEKLRVTRERLGPIEEFHSTKWTMEILPNGTFTTFEYDVRYARHPAHETITVVAPTREEGLFIFGHHIRSEGMEVAEESDG